MYTYISAYENVSKDWGVVVSNTELVKEVHEMEFTSIP
jgi:hypothetical protein